MSGSNQSTFSSSTDTIHAFTPFIFALNFINTILRKKLVPLQGEEIGRLIANALEGGITERRPWYEPAEKLPDQPIVSTPLQKEFDTLVVDLPGPKASREKSITPDRIPKPL